MCCLLVKTSCRYSEKESILSRSTENSGSVKVFNEFSLWSNWTMHSLREFSNRAAVRTKGVSIVAEWVVFTLYIYTMYTFFLLYLLLFTVWITVFLTQCISLFVDKCAVFSLLFHNLLFPLVSGWWSGKRLYNTGIGDK